MVLLNSHKAFIERTLMDGLGHSCREYCLDFTTRTVRLREHREVGRFFPINVYLQDLSSKANPLRGIVVRFTCVLQPVSMELP